MKVSKTTSSPIATAKKNRKVSPAGSTAFSDHLSNVKESSNEENGISETGTVSSVGGILAAQEISADDGQRQRQQMHQYGEDILDRLEEIRRDILIGAIPKERLTNLAQMLRAKKSTVDDPALIKIISDIELRAEVELAKLTRQI